MKATGYLYVTHAPETRTVRSRTATLSTALCHQMKLFPIESRLVTESYNINNFLGTNFSCVAIDIVTSIVAILFR